jgi:hypothetical protein
VYPKLKSSVDVTSTTAPADDNNNKKYVMYKIDTLEYDKLMV